MRHDDDGTRYARLPRRPVCYVGAMVNPEIQRLYEQDVITRSEYNQIKMADRMFEQSEAGGGGSTTSPVGEVCGNHQNNNDNSDNNAITDDANMSGRSLNDNPPERYASRDVELYASSFAPPPERGNKPDDGEIIDCDDGDNISTIPLVSRVFQRRSLAFFAAVLLVAVFAGVFVPHSQNKEQNNSISDSSGLRGNESTLKPPRSGLGDICAEASRTSDPLLTRECFQDCDKAKCCTYPDTDRRKCVNDIDAAAEAICAAYDVACSRYGDHGYGVGDGDGGEEYKEASSDQKIPMAPLHLADACSESALVQSGRAFCEELCGQNIRCCLTEFCRQNNAEACDSYQPCEILSNQDLNEAGGEDDGNKEALPKEQTLQEMVLDPSDIPTYCHGSAILTPEGVEMCMDLCKPGLCCLISPLVGKETDPSSFLRGVESCVDDRSDDFCGLYKDCAILLEMDAESVESSVIPVAPQNIADLCSKRGLMGDKYGECQSACNRAQCCWSDAHPSCENDTYMSETHRCDEYEPCVRLEGREPGVGDTLVDDDDWVVEVDGEYVVGIGEVLDEETNQDKSTGFSKEPAVTKATIDAACATASVLTPSGEKICEELCVAGDCCANGSCAPTMNCSIYTACDNIRDVQRDEVLTGGDNQKESTSQIDDSTAKGILEKNTEGPRNLHREQCCHFEWPKGLREIVPESPVLLCARE